MIKLVPKSKNKKTGPVAVTYRAGCGDVFGTCPPSCSLKPASSPGAAALDSAYMHAVLRAVPPNGHAWTYSHYPHELLPGAAQLVANNYTTVNYSADTPAQAVAAYKAQRPTVYAAPADTGHQYPAKIDGVKFVQCPAEKSDNFSCADCGGGFPLCARAARDYVIVFTGHGPGRELVGNDTEPGGCYGQHGHVRMQWAATSKAGLINDAAAVEAFAASLRPGSLLRHHVVGDFGAANNVI